MGALAALARAWEFWYTHLIAVDPRMESPEQPVIGSRRYTVS